MRVQPPGHCLVAELDHVRRDSEARSAVVRIRRRSSLRGCRPSSPNYTANIRGDLIFDRFEPLPSMPHCRGEHDLALQPDSTLEAALEPVKDQVSTDVSRVVQTSKSDLMARGVALDLLQMAKRIGP